MELKIANKTDNALMGRTEVDIAIQNTGAATPKRAEVRKLLAAQLSVDENLITIKKIKPSFGGAVKCSATLYKTRQELEQTEPRHLVGRDAGAKVKGGAGKKEEKK